jgi:AraC-like DNA-binding protein
LKTQRNIGDVPHSNVTVVEICDPTAAGDTFQFIEQDVIQLRSEPLRIRRVVVCLEAAVVIHQSTNRAVRSHSALRPGLMAVVAFGPHADGTVNGLLVHPHVLLIAAEGTECEFVVKSGYESISVCVPPADLEDHLRARGLWDQLQRQNGTDLLNCDPTKAQTLFSFGKRLAGTAAQQPQLFDTNKEVPAAARIELMEILCAAISSSKDKEVSRSDGTREAHSHAVQIAEQWVLNQTDGPLHVADLCKAAAVSERTLEYAFKEILGMTPVAFLCRLRLHRVRQALRAASPETTTVSAEAIKYGFWHFGDFSKAYKNCFGESPSDTLRREPGQS